MSTTTGSSDFASVSTSTAPYTTPSTTTYTPSTSTTTTTTTNNSFPFPTYTTFPPFYTLQPNLQTRARQLELWSTLITTYSAHHHLFRLTLSTLPADLFSNPAIHRSLKPSDIRLVLDHLSKHESGPRVEWLAPSSKGETSSTCLVYWKSLSEWADLIYGWVDETGQKGAVLTIYELREGEGVGGREWVGMDEVFLRKVLGVLVKRGKAQVFGLEESAGVKFF
ncbi:hypothetical protein LTR78_010614 [Recurvomyces mirabilis]|uniref:ESCRT-II complex subunit VPS25 n=1 Tax=Recurvomyces mirabilis TaxID=574656 RepID=A0AAE0TQ59_9PEZI|nr:hypothetical protein LTR78_010614 [Recurvomyces mirabilis]KAK5160195.1 hypothetical protein LTS14_002302 [Recurvomyces mirabilis]